jgi:hypothetical protein
MNKYGILALGLAVFLSDGSFASETSGDTGSVSQGDGAAADTPSIAQDGHKPGANLGARNNANLSPPSDSNNAPGVAVAAVTGVGGAALGALLGGVVGKKLSDKRVEKLSEEWQKSAEEQSGRINFLEGEKTSAETRLTQVTDDRDQKSRELRQHQDIQEYVTGTKKDDLRQQIINSINNDIGALKNIKNIRAHTDNAKIEYRNGLNHTETELEGVRNRLTDQKGQMSLQELHEIAENHKVPSYTYTQKETVKRAIKIIEETKKVHFPEPMK